MLRCESLIPAEAAIRVTFSKSVLPRAGFRYRNLLRDPAPLEGLGALGRRSAWVRAFAEG